jgi:hypothetical protein
MFDGLSGSQKASIKGRGAFVFFRDFGILGNAEETRKRSSSNLAM